MKEALKLALEALDDLSRYADLCELLLKETHPAKAFALRERVTNSIKTITAIKEALAQPEQEPVAYFNPQVKGGFYWAKPTKITAPITVSVEPMPLYTTPPQRKCENCGEFGTCCLKTLAQNKENT